MRTPVLRSRLVSRSPVSSLHGVGRLRLACAPLACALALTAASCGKDESNPADVNVLKLKTPLALTATPLSDSVLLSWFANNNEKEFSGYDVYVSTSLQNEIVKAFGLTQDPRDPQLYSSIRFRDGNEDEIESTRSNLSKYFNWDKASGANKAGDGKIFAPYVRCNVAANDGDGACSAVTEATENRRANGSINYRFEAGKLKADTTYAIFVSSTKDSGKEIGSPTSGVYFVHPHNVLTPPSGEAKADLPSSGSVALDGIDLSADTLAVTSGKFPRVGGEYCLPAKTDAVARKIDVYFQTSGGEVVITGANGTRISDLGAPTSKDGVLLDGDPFESIERPDAQVLLPEVGSATGDVVGPTLDALPERDDLGTRGGYSRCGQSRRVLAGHLYSVAFPNGKDWRYAVIAAPTTDTEEARKSLKNYRVVIGAAGERRL